MLSQVQKRVLNFIESMPFEEEFLTHTKNEINAQLIES